MHACVGGLEARVQLQYCDTWRVYYPESIFYDNCSFRRESLCNKHTLIFDAGTIVTIWDLLSEELKVSCKAQARKFIRLVSSLVDAHCSRKSLSRMYNARVQQKEASHFGRPHGIQCATTGPSGGPIGLVDWDACI